MNSSAEGFPTHGRNDERIAETGQIFCQRLAVLASQVGGRFRLKLRAETEPEPWSAWLIAPIASYLETGSSGPYPLRKVEWVEIEPSNSGIAVTAAQFQAAGMVVEVKVDMVRISCPM